VSRSAVEQVARWWIEISSLLHLEVYRFSRSCGDVDCGRIVRMWHGACGEAVGRTAELFQAGRSAELVDRRVRNSSTAAREDTLEDMRSSVRRQAWSTVV
jgi:hypothetical protein